jgi:hypothetical protein
MDLSTDILHPSPVELRGDEPAASIPASRLFDAGA